MGSSPQGHWPVCGSLPDMSDRALGGMLMGAEPGFLIYKAFYTGLDKNHMMRKRIQSLWSVSRS